MCGVTPWPIGRMMVSSLNGMDQKAVDVADRPRLLGVLADLPLAFKAGTECSCMPKRKKERGRPEAWIKEAGGARWPEARPLPLPTEGRRDNAGGQALSSGQTAHPAVMAGNQTHSWAGIQWARVA